METTSYIAAAQRLGVTLDEIKTLVKEKKLDETEPGRVSLESVYRYSGLTPSGRQTKKKRGRKPSIVDLEQAAKTLGIGVDDVERLIDTGVFERENGENGTGIRVSALNAYLKKARRDTETDSIINELSGDDRERSETERRFDREEMAMAIEVAFMRGRLSVYESLKSFERREK